MSNYTLKDLARLGPPHAFALLLQCVRGDDEPFVTYGSIVKLLELKLKIPTIFPTHIGTVAGALMDMIHEVDSEAPPINALITRPNGIPSKGFNSYYDRLWRSKNGRLWNSLTSAQKLQAVEEIRIAVRRYKKWSSIFRKLYRKKLELEPLKKEFLERDGKTTESGQNPGRGESEEHKRLKAWAASHPVALGLAAAMKGAEEHDLLSGDRIDVLFADGKSFVAVEVKSRLSSDDDLRRGIYQCVKYRAIVQAEQLPVRPSVRALLLTERPLNEELKVRARQLDVMHKVHRMGYRET